jgi:hypothetical protein
MAAPRMDDFVSKIVPDPKNPPTTLLLKGFIGASSEEGCVRLYLDSELSDYVEIPESAILYSHEVAKEKSPLGGSYVWIERDAPLIHGSAVTDRPKASFLEGRIMTTHACPEGGGPLPQTITGPRCGTIIDGCTDAGPRCPTQITCPAPCHTRDGPNCATRTGTTCPAPCPTTQSGPSCPTTPGNSTCPGPTCPTTPQFTCSGPNCPTTPDTTCCGPNCPTFPPSTCSGPKCSTLSGTTCPAPCPPQTQSGTTCPAPCPPPTQSGTTCPTPCTQTGPTCHTHPGICPVTVNEPICTKVGPSCPFPTEAGKTCIGPCHQP